METATLEKNRTEDMLNAAKQLDAPYSEGMNQGTLVTMDPPPSAVFAEPVVIAQPMQRSQRRVIGDFLVRMKALAQMAGEEYRYSFPVKTKAGGTKSIEGPTIKMANDLVREYGNCMTDIRVVETPTNYTFYARFIDYETGFCATRALRQRKGQKTMNTDQERSEDIVFQIGQSKALRNVVVNALQTYADYVYEEAKNSLVEKIGKDLPRWRTKIAEVCTERKHDLKRIEASVGKVIAEWLAPEIARVIAELKSVADGMATFDDLYPDPNKKDEPQAKGNEALKTALKKKEEAPIPSGNAAPVDTKPAAPEGQGDNNSGISGELKPEAKPEPKPMPFEIAYYKLNTQVGTKSAIKDLCSILEKAPVEDRTKLFDELGGNKILEVVGKHGLGPQTEKFTELGVVMFPGDRK